jgi:hypothetical protein
MNPIVIGGSGGAGTQAVARFLTAIGVQMGEYRNRSADALVFVDTLDALINPILETRARSITIRTAFLATSRLALWK